MTRNTTLIENLALQGLELAPSQVCGAIRLVPLLRRKVRPDLRLAQRRYGENAAIVALDGVELLGEGTKYLSYVPHGLVLSWTDDGSPVAAFGTRLQTPHTDGRRVDWGPYSVRVMHRMAKRERGSNQLRFLPLHLAMEGFLSLFFGGPGIAWSEYSRYALAQGLSPRWETSYSGQSVGGLAEALRVFEIHEGQVGVLVFVAEALASAFVVPTPEDYRALHPSLLEDFYGELLYQYALLYDTTYPIRVTLAVDRIDSLAGLRLALGKVRAEWAAYHGLMAGNLLGRDVSAKAAYSMGPFTLQHFLTDLAPTQENHIGEAIVRADGELEYLKTYRLSAAQTRRVYLLSKLAAHDWNLAETATALDTMPHDLVLRLEQAGFGYLFKNNILEMAQAQRRRERRA